MECAVLQELQLNGPLLFDPLQLITALGAYPILTYPSPPVYTASVAVGPVMFTPHGTTTRLDIVYEPEAKVTVFGLAHPVMVEAIVDWLAPEEIGQVAACACIAQKITPNSIAIRFIGTSFKA